MHFRTAGEFKSIKRDVIDYDTPDFMVITGANGVGKSNFFEGVALNKITVMDSDLFVIEPHQIKLITSAQLAPAEEMISSLNQYAEPYVKLHEFLQGYRQELRQVYNGDLSIHEDSTRDLVINRDFATAETLDRLKAATGKILLDTDLADLKRTMPTVAGPRDAFAINMTETFLAYQARLNKNQQEQWLKAEKGREDVDPFTDGEFGALYGPPPWELLDEALATLNLDYTVVAPRGTENVEYQARLLSRSGGSPILPSMLSSGEKALLLIALSLFAQSVDDGASVFPKLLLLDEPDASLHPEMVQSLLRVAHDVIYVKQGVKVIITTHSPTTVALAPERCLFTMYQDGGSRLRKVSTDEALANLTVGLPTLSVKLENRRQVFVESEHDERLYTKLFSLTAKRHKSPFSLNFIASGRGGQGNSIAVTHLVDNLREAGNTTVWGILDWDNGQKLNTGIVSNRNRYAIENLILDPLAVGLTLMQNGIFNATSLGLAAGTTYIQIQATDAATLVQAVCNEVLEPHELLPTVSVKYSGGFSCDVPKQWLERNGHELEGLILNKIPALKRHKDALKDHVLNFALTDRPGFIPEDAIDLFEQMLAVS